MKKQGLTNLILRIASAIVAVFAFIGMAFKFAFIKSNGHMVVTKNFSAFCDQIKDMEKLQDAYDVVGKKVTGLAQYQAARVFAIITLVLVAIVAVIAIVQLFWNHKFLTYALWAVAGLTVICALLFIILLTVGTDKIYGDMPNTSFGPHVGAVFMFLCPIIASALAVVPTFLKSKKA